MQQAFKSYKLLYEHKVNQYTNYVAQPGEQFVSNEFVGQAYLAIVLRAPSDARRRKYKIWSDLYAKIFTGKEIQTHVFTTLVCLYAVRWAEKEKKKHTNVEISRRVAANGAFHIARVAAALFFGKDIFEKVATQLDIKIKLIQADPTILDVHFTEAFSRVLSQISDNPAFVADLDAAFKASVLDEALTTGLWKPKKGTKKAFGPAENH